MTTTLSLELPMDRRATAAWLESISPTVLADMLEGMRLVYEAVATPDVQRMHSEQAEQTNHLLATHASRVETLTHSLNAERALTRAHMELERSTRRDEMEHLVHEEVKARCGTLPTTTTMTTCAVGECEKALEAACAAYYTARSRLPRNLGDVLNALPRELLGDISRQPSLFDAAVAKMKREHYRGSKRTRVGDEVPNDN